MTKKRDKYYIYIFGGFKVKCTLTLVPKLYFKVKSCTNMRFTKTFCLTADIELLEKGQSQMSIQLFKITYN